MGFLDKAKQAANELASKADGALANAGLMSNSATSGRSSESDRLFRELGMLTFRLSNGETDHSGERERIIASLHGLRASGQLNETASQQNFAPPPPPGQVAMEQQAGQEIGQVHQTLDATDAPQPISLPSEPSAPPPPPPPPSWAKTS